MKGFVHRSIFAAAMMVSALPASAAPVFFNDAAAFTAAAGALAGFEGFNDSRPVSETLVYAGFTLGESNGVDVVGHTVDFPGLLDAAVVEGAGAALYDDNDSSIGTFSFGASISAFGLWVTTNEAATMSVGGSGGSTSFDLQASVPAFFGLINLDGFTAVTFDASGGPLVGFDALRFGEASVVPEPATWAMLIAGFGLVGAAQRRRRALTA